MKLLILGLLVVVLLAGGSRHRAWRGRSDCYWQWRSDARERAFEARTKAFEAREEARGRARELREQLRAERERMRREIREEMRDWRASY